MPRLVTDQSFYKYLKCPNWVYFEAHDVEHRAHDPLMDTLIDGGLIDAKKREILSDREEIVEVETDDPERAFHETLAYMREGRRFIYGGALIDGHHVGRPDLLARVEGKSRLGHFYYVAADVKNSRHFHDEFKFQACFYAELLARIQGVKPRMGYVITPDNETLSVHIEEYEGTYRLTLDRIERILVGNEPAHFMTSGCKQSPWQDKCTGISRSCQDLSLLNRVWREEILRLSEAGVTTVETLADKSVSQLQKLAPDLRVDRIEIMRDQAIALRDNRHFIRHKVSLPEAPVEVFFDIESDPLRDFDYLFGVLSVGRDGEAYEAFFANAPEEELDMWQAFTSYIERHIDAPIYHYGTFERDVVNRFAARYGASELVREALERNMIDLLEVMRPAVIFPLSFYSLKDIASYVGFSWRAEDASGANSVVWFEKWMESKDENLKRKILEYNEDDVRATHVVQRWLRENASL